jgi:2-polyprenyl-6-methoxyphenol hydroxylase-like FAD-dependent oxidoreductase
MAGKRVLIVGAGIAGLAAAAALRRQAIDVDVLEVGRSWIVSGTGILQQANVVRAMASLGFGAEFLAAGFGFNRARHYDRQGTLLAETVLPRLAGFASPAMIGIARPALHQMLLAAATRAGARVTLGASVADLHPVLGGVHVSCTSGTSQRYDLVVGADGLHSRVRQLAFGTKYRPQQLPQAVWSCMLRRHDDIDCLMVQTGPEGHCGVCPVTPEDAYVYLTSNHVPDIDVARAALPALMRTRLGEYQGPVGALAPRIADGMAIACRRLETLCIADDWYREHVLLIGDAAHACAPHLGQGAGMAIEDAVVLAEELGGSQPVAEALARFMARRRERVEFIWRKSEELAAAEIARDAGIDRRVLWQQMLDRTAQPI